MTHHEVQFHRNRIQRTFTAICTCGWSTTSADEAEVQTKASTHDLDQQEDDDNGET